MLRRFIRYVDRVFDFWALVGTVRDSRRHPCISAQAVFYSAFLLFLLRFGSLNALEAHFRGGIESQVARSFGPQAS